MSLLTKLVLVLVALALSVVVFGLLNNRLPWGEPPGFTQRLITYLTTNVAETELDPRFPELRERSYPVAVDTLQVAADQALTTLGWTVVERNEHEASTQVVIDTPLWQFKDDLRIQLLAEGSRTRVALRSASRVGRGDLGTNTRHVLDFYAALEKALGVTNP